MKQPPVLASLCFFLARCMCWGWGIREDFRGTVLAPSAKHALNLIFVFVVALGLKSFPIKPCGQNCTFQAKCTVGDCKELSLRQHFMVCKGNIANAITFDKVHHVPFSGASSAPWCTGGAIFNPPISTHFGDSAEGREPNVCDCTQPL